MKVISTTVSPKATVSKIQHTMSYEVNYNLQQSKVMYELPSLLSYSIRELLKAVCSLIIPTLQTLFLFMHLINCYSVVVYAVVDGRWCSTCNSSSC